MDKHKKIFRFTGIIIIFAFVIGIGFYINYATGIFSIKVLVSPTAPIVPIEVPHGDIGKIKNTLVFTTLGSSPVNSSLPESTQVIDVTRYPLLNDNRFVLAYINPNTHTRITDIVAYPNRSLNGYYFMMFRDNNVNISGLLIFNKDMSYFKQIDLKQLSLKTSDEPIWTGNNLLLSGYETKTKTQKNLLIRIDPNNTGPNPTIEQISLQDDRTVNWLSNSSPFTEGVFLTVQCNKIVPQIIGQSNCDDQQISFVDINNKTYGVLLDSYINGYAIGFDKNNAYIILGTAPDRSQEIDYSTRMFKIPLK